ncbi:Helix-turn-helix domain protein [Planctomycetes bacterium Poly30]|uniref:Helix-turn-helix domain protein n=1 Tax=Saltatorellus ferox TaxID=2528018 RepID=A0A518ET70_9BACT|nr:Helix-turn-helix domain protein [Planctomycetes bacterium Poly30]
MDNLYHYIHMTVPDSPAGRPRLEPRPRGKVAEALRKARSRFGWSQVEAAKDLGIPQSTLAAWESGSKRPSHLAQRYLDEVWIPKSKEAGQ